MKFRISGTVLPLSVEDGIKMDLTYIGWGVWSGFTSLRIEIFGGLL
jgi:hypothetical protein